MNQHGCQDLGVFPSLPHLAPQCFWGRVAHIWQSKESLPDPRPCQAAATFETPQLP